MGRTLILDTSRPHESMDAYLAEPAGAPKGGIVVIQEIFGVNAHIRSVADRFAAEGYVAIAPALFDPVEKGVETGYDQEGMTKGVKMVAELGLLRPQQDVGIAAAYLQATYGVYLLSTRQIWAPRSGSRECAGLARSPAGLADFAALADAVARSERFTKLLEQDPA